MNRCPRCQQVLPDWQDKCQFCGAQVLPAPGTGWGGQAGTQGSKPAPWVWFAYYAVCGYFVISGLVGLWNYYFAQPGNRDPGSTISLGVGIITALGGLGLALRIEVVRGIANVLGFIKMIMGGLRILDMVMCGWLFGPSALIHIFWGALDIATGGLIIFLIGETDTRGSGVSSQI